jgi:hypothetical protein
MARASPRSAEIFNQRKPSAQAFRLIAVLEEQEAKRRLRVRMIFLRGSLQPDLRGCEVDQDASTEPIRLTKVEGCIGVAGVRQWTPDCDRADIVPTLPCIDAGLDALRRCRRCQAKRRTGENCAATENTHLSATPLATSVTSRSTAATASCAC